MDKQEQTRQRELARLAVHAACARRGWGPTELASHAKIDPGTAGDFLAGTRYPKIPTLAKIEAALEWPSGSITAIGAGATSPDEDGGPDDDLPILSLLNLTYEEEQRVADFVAGMRSRRTRNNPQADTPKHQDTA